PLCQFKLCPVGEVRKLRFHHLRHTTASLLLTQGADLAAVQRIMRHQDPRITTEVYGHLAPGYLKKEIDRLRLEPAPADQGPTASPMTAAAIRQQPLGHGPAHSSLGGRRFGAAAARRRSSRRRGSVFYPVSTQPPDRPCTLDTTPRNLQTTSRS